ncbi:MAG: hypothetical protein ACRDPC_28055, partial [Solirubrobacteraceae bacterium]
TDEAAPADEAPAGEAPEPPADEAASAGGAPEEKPKAARIPRAGKRSRKVAEEASGDEAGPNGRRDEDVPPPVPSGDPLGSPGERRP